MTERVELTNGAGAAAVLSAGIGSFCLGLLALLGDKSPAIKAMMVFYKPTGALSGVTTIAIVVWLACWAVMAAAWKDKNLRLERIVPAAFVLLALSFLMTFPPFVDLF
jgi:hypothetical protein